MPTTNDLTNAIRALAMDAVQAANSGHPGMPMGMAEIAEVLWRRHMRHNPKNPKWVNRDRFVVSNGHGSMLLYALLHLTGYDLPIEEIKRFRQLHSKTPGHPEYGMTPGVETTTGPLGQGISNAVGMALAEKLLAQEFNKPGLSIVDHYTYVFLGDGCLMEGISHEVCSLAGTLKLGKLICFYDDNGISIDGHVNGWFTDDTPKRFEAYGWHVVPNVDGHDGEAIERALLAAQKVTDKPSLICCKTVIGKGAPNKAGSHDVHGAALGEKEVAATRAHIGWPHAPFVISKDIYAAWSILDKGCRLEQEWRSLFAEYNKQYHREAVEFERRATGDLPMDWKERAAALLKATDEKAETIATRKASQNALAGLMPILPELIGGSADLTGSNLTNTPSSKTVTASERGNHIHYGVREFGMSAIMNGIALHGGFIPYGGTFLTFSDYSRNALRMAALMKIRSIFVFTHDSIGLGEDGPTHQSVEHAASLRIIPNMDVWRPCDTVESLIAWQVAIERNDGPSALLFSRQNIAFQKRAPATLSNVRRGGYVLSEAGGDNVQGPSSGNRPQAVIIATGSEVPLAVQAQQALATQGVRVRVVSMPCTNVFDRQDAAYRESVLPRGVPRVAVEAGVTDGWRKYVGAVDVKQGAVIGLDRFGESAPAGDLFKFFNITAERVAEAVRGML